MRRLTVVSLRSPFVSSDLARQPLCYEEARQEHIAANCPAQLQLEGDSETAVTVKVAMLQMNAVGVPVGADPVPGKHHTYCLSAPSSTHTE